LNETVQRILAEVFGHVDGSAGTSSDPAAVRNSTAE